MRAAPRGGIAPGGRPKSMRSAYFGASIGALDDARDRPRRLAATPRSGPLIIEEYDGTTVVPPDATARLDAFGNIVVEFAAVAAPEA